MILEINNPLCQRFCRFVLIGLKRKGYESQSWNRTRRCTGGYSAGAPSPSSDFYRYAVQPSQLDERVEPQFPLGLQS